MKNKFPISWKILLVTLFILLLAMVPVAFQLSNLFSELTLKREEDINREQTLAKSSEIISKLEDILDKSFVVGSLMYREAVVLKDERLKQVNKDAIAFNLERLRDIYRVAVYSKTQYGNYQKISEVVNREVLVKYKIPVNYHVLVDSTNPFPLALPFNNSLSVKNRTATAKNPVLSIAAPLVTENDEVTYVVLADFAFSGIQKSLISQDYRTIHIVDEDAQSIAHSEVDDLSKLKQYNSGARYKKIREIIENKIQTGQFFLKTGENEGYYSAYAKTPFGLTIFSETNESIIKEPAKLAARQVLFITTAVLFASLIIIFIFSNHITKPIAQLSKLMFHIAEGKFNVRAKSVIRSNDEVGDLAHWFDHMVEGLRERDRVKQLFAKFQGTQIAENLMQEGFDQSANSNERETVVFFSDIRGFTSFSEGKDPQEVVNLLNDYFSVMVNIITANYGVVDKFIGDAIMAVWGAPKSTGRDSFYAIRACVEMREALKVFNAKLESEGKPLLSIGIGLHTGNVVAGVLGSSDRMEYTVIGDTVNIASRIESETKTYGTDLLFSEEIYEKIKDNFTCKKVGQTTLKGKEKPTVLYTIV